MAKSPEFDLRKNYSKNYIINSNFDIWQRSTSLSIGPSNQAFVADRWKVVGPSSAAVVTASRSTSVPTFEESGFTSSFSHDINVTTIDAAATNFYLSYRLEGYDFQYIHKKTVTLSFWIYATRTGTSCVTFNNSADNRGYPAEFTINASNTWEKKEITLTLDQVGTWLLDNGQGMNIRFILNTAVAQQGTANTWQAGAIYGTANQINHLNTVSNKYRIAQVMLTEGQQSLPFRPYGNTFSEELAACQRYYEKSYNLGVFPAASSSSGQGIFNNNDSAGTRNPFFHMQFKMSKRIGTPNVVIYNPVTGATSSARGSDGGNYTVDSLQTGDNGFLARIVSLPAIVSGSVQFTADAEL